MRILLLTFCLVILLCPLAAQNSKSALVDVLFLKSGDEIDGTILEYKFQQRVVILNQTGEIKEVQWQDVRRVGYDVDRNALRDIAEDQTVEDLPDPATLKIPNRKIQHHLSSGLLFGVEELPFGNDIIFIDPFLPSSVNIIGVGLNYFAIKSTGNFRYGAGADVAVMTYARRENTVSGLLLAEYAFPLGSKEKVAVYGRLIGGPALPFGSSTGSSEITARSIGFLYNPSIGFELRSRGHDYNNLFLDFGYRFLDSKFTITTATLDVLERNINYRRVTVRAGYRF